MPTNRTRPTSLTPEQWSRARALYLYQTQDATRIATEVGAHVSAVRAAIRNSDWNRRLAERRRREDAAQEQSAAERAEAERRHDARIVTLTDIALDAWETGLRRLAVELTDCAAKDIPRFLRGLLSPQDAQRMQRTATGRPVTIPAALAASADDRELSLLDRLRATGCRTVPFPGDEAEEAAARAAEETADTSGPKGEA